MPKTTRIILFITLIAAIFIGGSQLSSNNDIFAGAMARCCNNGLCHDALCSSTSSILPCSGSEYIADCEWCMEVVTTLRNCNKYSGAWPTWCNLSDGTRYYAY